MPESAVCENVRIYLKRDFGGDACGRARREITEAFAADSIRRYFEDEGKEPPVILPDSLSFGRGPHGKPFVANPDLQGIFFSLSHTKEILICAVAESEVGCDIEQPAVKMLDKERKVRIAERFFSKDEYMKVLDDPEVFYSIWTKKEAYAKWTGRGLAIGMPSFSVFDLPERIVCENIELAAAPDAVCAICREKLGADEKR